MQTINHSDIETQAQRPPLAGMNTLYARSYDLSYVGFYFTSYEDFTAQMEQAPFEEVEIEVIDGPDAELLSACRLGQCEVRWLEGIEELDAWTKPALFFVMDHGLALDVGQGIDLVLDGDVCVTEGNLLDVASELFNECYAHEVPESVRSYIDYERFANDCRLGGDLVEFRYEGMDYVCTNANGL